MTALPRLGKYSDRGRRPELAAKIVKLQARQARHAALLKQLEDSGETQISRTNPDARALRKGGQQLVGYNVQNSVDSKHRLTAHYDVTNAGNDTQQLAPQALAVKEVLGVEAMIVVVDAGYLLS